ALEAGTLLGGMSAGEETRLLDLLAGLNQFDVTYALLAKLASLRSRSDAAYAAFFGVALVQAKAHIDRSQWGEAEELLSALRQRSESSAVRLDGFYLLAMNQMLGVCACMQQDFERALQAFRAAQEIFQREVQQAGTQEKAQRFFNAQG